MAEDAEDRDLPASAKRLQKAREQGNVPLSHDLASLASFGMGLLLLIFGGPFAARRLMVGLRWYFLAAGDGSITATQSLLHGARLIALIAGPLALGVMLAGLSATWLQTGFLFHLGAIGFDLSRLSPGRGLKRIFSLNHLMEEAKSVLRIGVVGLVVGKCLWRDWQMLQGALYWPPERMLGQLLGEMAAIVLAMVMAQAVIVGGDFLWVRLKHARGLRMSREEMKQEHKDAEGDPHVKGKRKRIRAMRHRQRIRAAVARATVVITNPTHYAVALVYERGKEGAPRVVAKGVDEVAARIREIADEHRVPQVRNPPLARALYLVELESEIPAEYFQAVAEIIAYVWRLKTAFRAGSR